MRYNEKYFYTLKEIADLVYDETPFYDDDEIALNVVLTHFVGGVPKQNITNIPASEWEVAGSPLAYGLLHKLWMYILSKYADEYIGYGEIENPNLTEAKANPTIVKSFRMMEYKMVESYPRYKKLIDLYEAEKDHLMDDIKSWTRFNDTPQLADTYKDEKFATSYTEYGNQYASKIARIKEIDDEMRNLMGDWCDEFARCFIE